MGASPITGSFPLLSPPPTPSIVGGLMPRLCHKHSRDLSPLSPPLPTIPAASCQHSITSTPEPLLLVPPHSPTHPSRKHCHQPAWPDPDLRGVCPLPMISHQLSHGGILLARSGISLMIVCPATTLAKQVRPFRGDPLCHPSPLDSRKEGSPFWSALNPIWRRFDRGIAIGGDGAPLSAFGRGTTMKLYQF